MSNIANYLNKILSARYGRDVRQAIHDGIQQCYYEGKAGEIDLQARQDIEALNGEVDSLKEEDIAMKNDIEVLQNASDIVSATKTIMSHSSEGKLLIKEIGGASEQKKYSGKNLIPLPHDVYYPHTSAEVTYTYDDKTGYITANGTANSHSYDYSVLNVQARTDSSNPFYLPKGKYKFTCCPKNGSTSTYYISVGYTATDGTYGSYGVDQGDGFEFEVTDETRPMQIQIKIRNGYTANNLVFKPMITNADIADDSFEPYVGGPAPNPYYPQEIKKSVINAVKTHGKNLIPYPYVEKANVDNGIKWIDLGDGTIIANGTATADIVFNVRLRSGTEDNNPLVLEAGTYQCSGCPMGGKSNTYRIRLGKTENGSFASIIGEYGKGAEFTLIEKTQLQVQICINTGTTVNNLVFNPMIRRAEDSDVTYEPYKESSIVLSQPIELCGIEVTANDDYTYEKDGKYYISDTIEMIDGEYKKVQRIGKKVFDGINEVCTYVNNSVPGATETLIQINLGNGNTWADSKYSTRTIMSDKAILFYYVNAASCFRYGIWQSDTSGICCLYVGLDDGVTDIETANAWLQSNPITIFYVLANPIITSLPTADQMALNSLVTFEGITYLKFDSEIEPTFSGEYGTNKVGGYTLESLLLARNNDIRISSVEASIVNNI